MGYLRRDETYSAAPSKANTTEGKQGQIKAICPTLDLGQDLAIML
jgi:hypothetical protein